MSLALQVKFSFSVLNTRDKLIYLLAILSQSMIGLLDLIGIATLAFLVSESTKKFSGNVSPSYAADFFNSIGITTDSKNLYIYLGTIALGLFLLKSILALYFSKRLFRFLSRKQTELSQKIFMKTLQSEYTWAKQQDPRKISHAMMAGFSALVTNTLGQLLLIFSELFLILIFFVVLFLINPILAVLTLAYFGIVFYYLNIIII